MNTQSNITENRIEQLSREYMARERIAESLRYFHYLLEKHPRLSPELTRWEEPRLARNQEQISRVRAWGDFEQCEDSLGCALSPGILPRGILLAGPTGRGKTRSLFALMRSLSHCGVKYRYWFSGDWFAQLGRQIRYGRDEAMDWVETVAGLPLVIIDDIGQEAQLTRQEDWAMSWFFRLLDLRISNGKPLIASTNLSAEQLIADNARKAPLLRRLTELCEVVKFTD